MNRRRRSSVDRSRRRWALELCEARLMLDASLPEWTLGAELAVNSYTVGAQSFQNASPQGVAVDGDGDSVIVWSSASQDGDGSGVYGQRFDDNGLPAGGEFRVNEFTAGDQSNAAVAMDADGDFVVVWSSNGQDEPPGTSTFGIFARRYDAAGQPRGGEFLVNQAVVGYQHLPSVGVDAQGNFVISWGAEFSDGTSAIMARLYDQRGLPLGDEFLVAPPTAERTKEPHVARNQRGDFVIAWQYATDAEEADTEIYARSFRPDGAPATEPLRVHEFSEGQQLRPSVAISDAGQFAVVWYNQLLNDNTGQIVPRDVYVRRFTLDGAALDASERRANSAVNPQQRFAAAAMNSAGDLIVAWQSIGQIVGGTSEVYLQRYAASGEPIGGETLVNQYTVGSQRNPAIALNADGDGLIAWTSDGQDGDNSGIFARSITRVGDATPPMVANVFAAGDTAALADDAVLTQAADRLVVTFSEAIAPPAGGNPRHAWRLTHNGVDATAQLAVVGYAFNGATNRHEATLDLSAPLADGDYALSALPSLRDLEGRMLDGNYDGVGADAFVRRFAVATPAAAATEFGVNHTTVNHQSVAASAPGTVATDAAGNAVFVWSGGSGQDIFLRRFDAAGAALDDQDVLVNAGASFQSGTQHQPTVARAPDGRFVVVWTSVAGTDAGDIYARLYDAAGTAVGNPFLVNDRQIDLQEQPTVTMADDGSFAVAWVTNGHPTGSGADILYRRFNASGQPLASATFANPGRKSSGSESRPQIASDSFGNFVVAWTGPEGGNLGDGIFANYYAAATGKFIGAEFLVNTDSTGNQRRSSVAMNAQGDFVIAWQSSVGDASSDGIFARRFGADFAYRPPGEPPREGPQFPVTSVTLGSQQSPSVALDQGGQLVIAWQGPSAGAQAIFARRFAWNGISQGDDQQVSGAGQFMRSSPSVATAPEGGFWVAWNSPLQDGSQDGVFARRWQSDVNRPPVADAGGPYAIAEGDTLPLDASASFDPDADQTALLRFHWDLDDDGVFDDLHDVPAVTSVPWSLLQAIGVRDDGAYPVRVQAVDPAGRTSISEAMLNVSNTAPANLQVDPTTTIVEGGAVTLHGSFEDPGAADAHRVEIVWDAVAPVVETLELPAGQFTFTATRVFPDESGPNGFPVSIRVLDDDDGASPPTVVMVKVDNASPQLASYQLSDDRILEGQSLTIVGDIHDDGPLDQHTVTILWGDGRTSAATVNQAARTFTATHAYVDEARELRVNLRDDDGGVTLRTLPIEVRNVRPTIDRAVLSSVVVAGGDLLSVTGEFTDPGSADEHFVFVDWGDDQPQALELPAGARTFRLEHQYAPLPPGVGSRNFPIFITLADNADEFDTSALEITVISCGLPGDTDFNCAVDVTDLNNVRNTFGSAAAAGEHLAGDAYPFDGKVDVNDLNAVRNHFGESAPASQAIPTPARTKQPARIPEATDAIFSLWPARSELEQRWPRRQPGAGSVFGVRLL